MKSNKDRIGEKNINNFGSEMIIVDYRKYSNIDVYFPEYDWTFKGADYRAFQTGQISCPYEKRTYGVGCIGEGKYKTRNNGKITNCYKTWSDMLRRCYCEKYQEKYPTYINCKVYKEWHNFQNFAKWYEDNYYEVEGERMELDKDILVKHNKIYSPDTCVFVPHGINTLFVKSDKTRGDSVIGAFRLKNGKYRVYCHIYNFNIDKSKYNYLGCYDTQQKAFETYKYYKEKNIKMVADYYKNKIPKILYDALYNYEVEITD